MSVWDGNEDRFNLLLLSDDEYYFRDFACILLQPDKVRAAGYLKVCSKSLYFVPRDQAQPISRVPYLTMGALERWAEAEDEEVLLVSSQQHVEMCAGKPAPYVLVQASATWRFAMVFTSLEEVLPLASELRELELCQDTKAARLAAKDGLHRVIQEHEAGEVFNPGWLEEESERVELALEGACVRPLQTQNGRVVITQLRIYFQPYNIVSNAPTQTYQLRQAQWLAPRTYQLADVGLEVFLAGRDSLYLAFRSTEDRERASKAMAAGSVDLRRPRSRRKWLRDWQRGRVSNFAYLMFLNGEAGRSFKDLAQYPVFPWVVQDCESSVLDLDNPATFRDLSKPIGALNPKRLAAFQERYWELKEMCEVSQKKVPGAPPPLDFPPFLYGCHYSCPGYVVYYLMRSEPQLMLRLQNGRFDAPDRVFWSVADTWRSCTTLPTDVKELTPEFYGDPSFLLNTQDLDLGVRAGGQRVGDVELPPWASDAADFVSKLAQALESPHCSANLHHWIDLIFGYKSRGRAALKADNVFHYYTYDEIALAQLDSAPDNSSKEAVILQSLEFGRTPKQLFKTEAQVAPGRRGHPRRKVRQTGEVGGGLVSCFRAKPRAVVSRPVNNLRPAFLQGKVKGASAASRAVAKLCSSKPATRAASLEWIEQTARSKEPGHLALQSQSELVPLVQQVEDKGGLEACGEGVTVTRALRALATAPSNRSLLLDAGCLDLVLQALSSSESSLVRHGAATLALLSAEGNDPRIREIGEGALARLSDILRAPPSQGALGSVLSWRGSGACTNSSRSSLQSVGTRSERESSSAAEPAVRHSPSQQFPVEGVKAEGAQLPSAASPLRRGHLPSEGKGPSAATSEAAPRPASASRTGSGGWRMTKRRALQEARSLKMAEVALPSLQAERDEVMISTALAIQNLARSQPNRVAAVRAAAPPVLLRVVTSTAEPMILRTRAAEALAALLEDEEQKLEVLRESALPQLLQVASPLSGPLDSDLQAAASRCLAQLSTNVEAKTSLCHPASLSVLQALALPPCSLETRTAAGAVLANVCTEAGPAAAVAERPELLRAICEMTRLPDRDAQRHSARVLWHLLTAARGSGSQDAVVSECLPAVLGLATSKVPQGRPLARQALRRLAADSSVRPLLLAKIAESHLVGKGASSSPALVLSQLTDRAGDAPNSALESTPQKGQGRSRFESPRGRGHVRAQSAADLEGLSGSFSPLSTRLRRAALSNAATAAADAGSPKHSRGRSHPSGNRSLGGLLDSLQRTASGRSSQGRDSGELTAVSGAQAETEVGPRQASVGLSSSEGTRREDSVTQQPRGSKVSRWQGRSKRTGTSGDTPGEPSAGTTTRRNLLFEEDGAEAEPGSAPSAGGGGLLELGQQGQAGAAGALGAGGAAEHQLSGEGEEGFESESSEGYRSAASSLPSTPTRGRAGGTSVT